MALLRTITFLSAFLLFQIELIIAKLFLPNYGGSYLVWGACIVFFQAVLLAGYIFAHTFLKRLGTLNYFKIHLFLLFIPLIFFPVSNLHILFVNTSLPLVFDIFVRLIFTIGPVFFVLSTMSLVTQNWLADSFLAERRNPYSLYAVSNLGSFIGLLSYPFVFEQYLTNTEQLQIWRILYFVLVFGNLLAWNLVKVGNPLGGDPILKQDKFTFPQTLSWVCLGAAGVVLFLSVTNIMTYEVAPVPLLWIFPLGIYLLAFILNFSKNPWCPKWIERYIGPVIGLAVLMYFLPQKHFLPVVVVIALLCVFLFLICMYIQRQLILSKPSSDSNLTFFYVMISLGGFLGGILTSWVIPLISNALIEYLAGLFLVVLMLPQMNSKEPLWKMAISAVFVMGAFFVWPMYAKEYHFWFFALLWVIVGFSFYFLSFNRKWMAGVLAVIIIAVPILESIWQNVHFILKKRNYYGIYEVYDNKDGIRLLIHGTTLHGLEFTDEARRSAPLGYYSPVSAIGSLLISDAFLARRVGVVGLGTGTLSMYAKPNCPIDYYELDGDVQKIAYDYFWYLKQAPGQVNVILGDARLSLKNAPDGAYDLLAIDAFSGDAIPTHLVNKDVLAEYRRKLSPRGAIVFHITNRYLNLGPVLAKIAVDSGAHAAIKDVGDQGMNMRSIWCILMWDDDRFLRLITQEDWVPLEIPPKDMGRIWTDDYSTILPIINMGELAISLKAFKFFKW